MNIESILKFKNEIFENKINKRIKNIKLKVIFKLNIIGIEIISPKIEALEVVMKIRNMIDKHKIDNRVLLMKKRLFSLKKYTQKGQIIDSQNPV